MGVYLEDLTYKEILPILARTGKPIDTRKIIDIDLVRCGECKKVDTFMCPMFSAGWGYTDDDWCSEGERRADEHTD